MTSPVSNAPFGPSRGAAIDDANSNSARLAEIRAERPAEWQAVRITRYWNGAVAVVLLLPDGVAVDELDVTANGIPQNPKLARDERSAVLLIATDVSSIEVHDVGREVHVAVRALV